MNFYRVNRETAAVQHAGPSDVRLRIIIDWNRDGIEAEVQHSDIIEARFRSLNDESGWTTASGSLLLDNRDGRYSSFDTRRAADAPVRVAFAADSNTPFYDRFQLYIDDQGIIEEKGPALSSRIRITLVDYAERLRKVATGRSWGEPLYFTDLYISDPSADEDDPTVLSALAAIAGIDSNETLCNYNYRRIRLVEPTKSVREELAELARAYRAHIETPIEMKLIFVESPYEVRGEKPLRNTDAYAFHTEEAYNSTVAWRDDYYRNIVNLDYDMPIHEELAEVWRYRDPPISISSGGAILYPFTETPTRAIQLDGYVAPLSYTNQEYGTLPIEIVKITRNNIYDAMNLEYANGAIEASNAILDGKNKTFSVKITSIGPTDVEEISLDADVYAYKRGAGFELRDEEEIAMNGVRILTVRNKYLGTEFWTEGDQYKDWVEKELADRKRRRKVHTLKMQQIIFQARVDAGATLDGVRIKVCALEFIFERGKLPMGRYELEEV